MNKQNKEALKNALISLEEGVSTYSSTLCDAFKKYNEKCSEHKEKSTYSVEIIVSANLLINVLKATAVFETLNLKDIFDKNELPENILEMFEDKKFSGNLQHCQETLSDIDHTHYKFNHVYPEEFKKNEAE